MLFLFSYILITTGLASTALAHPFPAKTATLANPSATASAEVPSITPLSSSSKYDRLVRRKKGSDEPASLVTTDITVWDRPNQKAFPSADNKNVAFLDMRKQKVVKQYPWKGGALVTANATVTSKSATLTYREKIVNQTSAFNDKVVVLDQASSTVRIDEVDCDIDDAGQGTCSLIQQSGTAEPVTITAKPAPIKMKAKFRATVYDQMPTKLASQLTAAGDAVSSKLDDWESKYGTFVAPGGDR